MKNKIYYASDYHFFHELALKRSRQSEFKSVEEMNKEIIERHNKKVNEDDDIYILGDIIVCEDSELEEKLKLTIGRMKGHLHLIIGNHDYKYKEKAEFLNFFESVEEASLIRDNGRWVHLFHYPMLTWYKKERGAYHIHGHLHDEKRFEEFKILCTQEKALSACVEINDFEPCTIEELVINNNKFKDIQI